MKQKLTVTIAIPAYNEEATIGLLLSDILSQETKSFVLSSIVVCSDRSADRTEEIVKSVKDKRIKLLKNKKRQGQAVSQNKMLESCDSDIVVLLNADVRIHDKVFIEKLIQPIVRGKADLTSATVQEVEPKSFMEKVLQSGMQYKRYLFTHINNGNNVFSCHGRARALSKRLYSKLRFKRSIGEDAYSYLFARSHGFTYKLVKNSVVYFKLPETMRDHENQSVRYFISKSMFVDEFGEKFVHNEYHFPSRFALWMYIKTLFTNPYFTLYTGVLFYMKFSSIIREPMKDLWTTSKSSKVYNQTTVL